MTEEQTVNIKQRIIGAIILVSLGVILIPLLLNGGPDLNQGITGSNIPPMPQKLTKELPSVPQSEVMPAPREINIRPVEDFSRNLNKDTVVAKETKKVEETIVKNDHKEVVKPTTKKIKAAYTLQIASFSKKKNAYGLRDKLRKKRFKAYVESYTTSKGTVYRLRVGPYLKYEQISAAQKQIEKQFKVTKTVIVNYKT